VELRDLISLQSEILKDYLNNVWTTFATYVLGMSWIITFAESRTFLHDTPAARHAVIIAAGLILLIEIGTLFFLRYKSESLYRYIQTTKEWTTYALSESEGQPIDSKASKLILLETRRITILFPIISSIIGAILCFSFITMVVCL